MGTTKFTISHQRINCIGCGHCSFIAPHTWSMNDEDGLSDLKNSKQKGDQMVAEVDMDLLEDNILAEQSCPVSIIRISQKK